MRIVFNAKGVGLGNNGGSRTIIRCAETIQDLGHEVFIASDTNKYKWHKIKVRVLNKIPKCDVVVATGFGSVRTTLGSKAKKKFYYIRGFEIWRTSKRKLFNSYKSLSCIVNSLWLKDYFRSKGVKSRLVYPGLDFEDFYVEKEDRAPILGGLFSKKHATKRHGDVIRVGKELGIPVKLINRDIQHATPNQLRTFYNNILIWMSPSELEGLHNPPYEASLCGASLVGTDHLRGGIKDYAKNEQTALLYSAGVLDDAIVQIKRLLENVELRRSLQKEMQDFLKNSIGDRRKNMSKFIKVLEGSLK